MNVNGDDLLYETTSTENIENYLYNKNETSHIWGFANLFLLDITINLGFCLILWTIRTIENWLTSISALVHYCEHQCDF